MEPITRTESPKALAPLPFPHTRFVTFAVHAWNLASHPAQKKRKAMVKATTTALSSQEGSRYDGVPVCWDFPAKRWSASEAYAALCHAGSSTADYSRFAPEHSATAAGLRLHAPDDALQLKRNKMALDFVLNPSESCRPPKKRRATETPNQSWPERACGNHSTSPGPSSNLLQHPGQPAPHPPLSRPFTTFSTLPGIPMEYAAYPGAIDVGRLGNRALLHETEWEDGDRDNWNGTARSSRMPELAEVGAGPCTSSSPATFPDRNTVHPALARHE